MAVWLLATGAGVCSAGPVFHGLTSGSLPSGLESVQANALLRVNSTGSGTVVGIVDDVDPTSGTVRDAVRAAATDLARIPGVTSIVTPYSDGLPRQDDQSDWAASAAKDEPSKSRAAAQISRDGRAIAIQVQLGDLDNTQRHDTSVMVSDRLRRLGGQLGAQVQVGGSLALSQQANDAVQRDLGQAEEYSLPLTLVILVFVFGGLVAAGLPVLAALVSGTSAMTVLLGFAAFTDLDSNAVTVVTLFALGLSIDYGLLLVSRYRQERGRGHKPDEAVARAWATAGRTVLFSALTVAAAMSGALLFGIRELSALGAAGISIALVAMLVSLTFTAALIGAVHRRIRPSKHSARWIAAYANAAESGFFARLARPVQQRPLVTAVLTGAALLAAGAPLLSTSMHLADVNSLPRSLEAVNVAQVLADRFGVTTPGVTVVAGTDPASLDAWAGRWRGTTGVSWIGPARQLAPGLSTVDIGVSGDPEGAAARALVAKVRADRPPGGKSLVTGDAALLTDLLRLLERRLPWAIGVTVLAMTVLLFAMTGSLVVPVKAVVMNVVSLGAAFGVMSTVFEHSFLAGPLGVITVAGLDPFVMVIIFAGAFGLSMDYQVFLLARIKEYADRGLSTGDAVRLGLQNSGRIITSAALLMVVVFGAFVFAGTGTVQQVGLGLTVAIAVDATIVRCVLVPATMTLLGQWNWWAPGWLQRLHERVRLREGSLADVALPGPADTRPVSATMPAEPIHTAASPRRSGRVIPVAAAVVVTVAGVLVVAAGAYSLGRGSATVLPPSVLPPLTTSSVPPLVSEQPSPSAIPLSPASDSPAAGPTAQAPSKALSPHPVSTPSVPAVPPAPGTRTAFAVIQAESFAGQSGTQSEGCADAGGGQDIGYLAPGDWLAYDKVDFGASGATRLLLRFASGLPTGMSGRVEVRLDGIGNPPVGGAAVGNTGGWQNWITVPANLTEVTGLHTVYLTFTSSSGWEIGNINWFTFER